MRDIVYSLTYGVATRAVLLIINIIAVKLLIPDEYGIFSYFLGVVASIATFSGFGAGITANTYVAKNAVSNPDFAKKIVFSSIIFVSILAVISSLILLPLLHLPDQQIVKITWQFPFLVLALVWLINMNGVAEGALNGLRAYKRLSQNAVGVFAVGIPMAFFLVWQFGFWGGVVSVLGYRLLMVVFNGVTLYRAGYLIRASPIAALQDRVITKAITDVSVPSVLGALMVGPVIAMAMRLISDMPGGFAELAYFSWVYQIYIVAVFVPSALGGYFLSRFSRTSTSKNGLNSILKFNLIFSMVVMLGLFLSKSLLLGLAGDSYLAKSNLIFNLMAPAVVLYGINSTFASYWPAIGRAWVGFIMNLLWAGTLLFTTWYMLSYFGAAALALGFLVAYGMQLVVQVVIIIYIPNRMQ